MYTIDLLLWAVFGGLFGFIYAWRRLRGSTNQARSTIESVPDLDRVERARALGHNTGLRLGAGLIFSAIGAVIGAALWGLLYLLYSLVQ
jgi:hypothetical protein